MTDIKQILKKLDETTVSGSVASSPMPLTNKIVSRTEDTKDNTPEVIEYGNWGNSSLVTNNKLKKQRKTSSKVTKSIYGESVAGTQKCWPGHRKVGTQPGTGKNAGKRVNKCVKIGEEALDENDLIINPLTITKKERNLIPRKEIRTDHEIEMTKNDLFQTSKNALCIFNLIKDIPETHGLEGWVQEKLIKANDYLNTVREYLEGKKIESMSGDTTKIFAESQKPKIRKYTKKIPDGSTMERWEVLDSKGSRVKEFDDKKLAQDYLKKNKFDLMY